jgi:hypothetical protein
MTVVPSSSAAVAISASSLLSILLSMYRWPVVAFQCSKISDFGETGDVGAPRLLGSPTGYKLLIVALPRSLPECWFDHGSSLQRVSCYDVVLTIIATRSIQLPSSTRCVNEISIPFSVLPQTFATTSGTTCLTIPGSLRVQGPSTCFGLFCS